MPIRRKGDGGGGSAVNTSVSKTFEVTATQTVFDIADILPSEYWAINVFRNGLLQSDTEYSIDATAKTVTLVTSCNSGDIVVVIFNAALLAIPIPKVQVSSVGDKWYLYNRMGGF